MGNWLIKQRESNFQCAEEISKKKNIIREEQWHFLRRFGGCVCVCVRVRVCVCIWYSFLISNPCLWLHIECLITKKTCQNHCNCSFFSIYYFLPYVYVHLHIYQRNGTYITFHIPFCSLPPPPLSAAYNFFCLHILLYNQIDFTI